MTPDKMVASAHVLANRARDFATRLRAGDNGHIRPEPNDYDELADTIIILAKELDEAKWHIRSLLEFKKECDAASIGAKFWHARAMEIRVEERTRIVAKIRDIATRFEPGSASQNNHNALARAIESGHAFAEGNPK